MADQDTTTIIDLDRLTLSHGEGTRLDVPIVMAAIELGGQSYRTPTEPVAARVEVSRTSSGFALRLHFATFVEGPCTRCLEAARLDVEIDSREVDQPGTSDNDLVSPYVNGPDLDVGRWAIDAVLLDLPEQILCRPDCLGLCPVCGEPLNDTPEGAHDHAEQRDARWAALDVLRSDDPA